MSAPSPADPPLRFRAASELTLRLVDWLWPGRLALGQISILEGDPGLGKSFLALDLCARLSTGRPWPDGAPAPPPATAVFLNGEDNEETTVGPRLRALGADLARVFLLEREDGGLASTLSLPAQTDALEEVVARTQARLLVIDPVMHFLGPEVNTASVAGIRRALAPLAALAQRHACAVLLHRHLNKTEGRRALYRGLGSIGLVGACRSSWLVAEESQGSGRRVLAQVKNNLAPPQPSLAFEVTQPEGGLPTLSWLGPVDVSADDLVGLARRRGPEPTKRQSAAAFLTELLAGGPMKVRDVWDRVLQEGLSAHTVRRAAKEEVGIRSRLVMEDGRRVNWWLLPGQVLPGEDKPEEEMDEIERRLKELSEMFPPRTPLEDDDDF
ncbi:MAG TPA: AAA family ATPase [Gemmataceae bacterium]|nr:AAA family ATPase [Gemmataceae bacterium]